MIFLFINASDRTSDLERNSLQINDEIQKKANTCNFKVISGAKPTENQEVLIYDGTTVTSAASNVLTLPTTFKDDGFGKFRSGDTLWLDIGTSNEEKVIVDTVDSETQITLVSAPVNAPSGGELIGKKIFGGIVGVVRDMNVKLLTQLEYRVSCVDFTKPFDRKNINNTYEDADARYIMNDAVNGSNGINLSKTIDDFDYDDNSAIQTAYTEADDGNNPTIDDTDFLEQDASGVFSWTNTGTNEASWSATVTSMDGSELTGVSSGTPTKGQLMVWADFSDVADVTSFKIQIGSDSSNYLELSFDLPAATQDGKFTYLLEKLIDGTVTGTPVWTALDYVNIIVAETGNGSVKLNGLRLLELSAFTFFNFEKGLPFTDFRASFQKPTNVIDRLAKFNQFFWYIDYDRDIHFFDKEETQAPISLTDTSNNFDNLSISVDTTNLKNRQVVRGGEKTSTSTYSQVVAGDDAVREWIMKNKFKNLTIFLDNNTSTDTTEGGTTTTNITATAHGLVDGDYIVNRTRSNAVREVTKVDDDNFTVEAVASQTSGDTFSKFATSKTVGIEGITDETTVDYVSNFNEKSIRATASEATLDDGEFLLFKYNEVFPIRVQRIDAASIASLKFLIGGDGIFDGAVITDRTIDSSTLAQERAQAELEQYSNPIVSGSFVTDQEGLKSGQIIRVTDSNRSVDTDYLIQKISARAVAGQDGAYWIYSVTFASTLFGIIEFFQKLLSADDQIQTNEDEVIDTILGEEVEITIGEANQIGASIEKAESATITIGESNTDVLFTPPYVYEPDGASDSRYNLAQYA